MSGLIEKITLYDLLGYALPGSILLGAAAFLCMKINGNIQSMYDTYKESLGYFFIVLLALGYVTGMLIAEITEYIIHVLKESLSFETEQYFREHNLNYAQIEQTLKKAGYLKHEDTILDVDDVIKYLPSMYGNIQSDAKYNRLHNYASSKLIYKNMAFVSYSMSVLMFVMTIWKRYDSMFMPDLDLLLDLLAVAGLIFTGSLFIRRWKRMYLKTYFYTVVWFAEKYA